MPTFADRSQPSEICAGTHPGYRGVFSSPYDHPGPGTRSPAPGTAEARTFGEYIQWIAGVLKARGIELHFSRRNVGQIVGNCNRCYLRRSRRNWPSSLSAGRLRRCPSGIQVRSWPVSSSAHFTLLPSTGAPLARIVAISPKLSVRATRKQLQPHETELSTISVTTLTAPDTLPPVKGYRRGRLHTVLRAGPGK
jgi:hypothetical protein